MAKTEVTFEMKQDLINEHFYYEVQLLGHILLIPKKMNVPEQAVANIGLNAFLPVARNLVDFFYSTSTNENYARAFQFFENKSDWKPKKTEWFKNFKQRVNCEVTHLTYMRIKGKPKEKAWEVSVIYFDLLDLSKKFLNSIDNKYLQQNGLNLRNFLNAEEYSKPPYIVFNEF